MVNECKSVVLMFVWRLHAILKSGSMMDSGYKRIPVVLVHKIGNFLGKVAKPWQGSKAHLSSAHKILPHQGPPANVAITSAPKLVRNFTPSLGPSPDVAADSQAPANV